MNEVWKNDEKNFEEEVIEIFKRLDYTYLTHNQLFDSYDNSQRPLIKDVGDDILISELEKQIRELNPGIKDKFIHDIVKKIKSIPSFNRYLLSRNKEAFEYIQNGIKVHDEENKIWKTFKIIDLEKAKNNSFIVTNQFIYKAKKIENIYKLTEILKNTPKRKIFISTLQKFAENKISDWKKLSSKSKNILVIVDEAHRSWTNINEVFDQSNDFDNEQNEEYKEDILDLENPNNKEKIIETFKIIKKVGGFSAFIKKYILPYAVYCGFTATPIETEDKSTTEIFGRISSTYMMSEAIQDNKIVNIFYEDRLKKYHYKSEQGSELDSFILEKELSLESENEREAFRKKVKAGINIQKLIHSEERIKAIIQDFLIHYHRRKRILKAKAMLVCFDRECARKYYYKIQELDPDLAAKTHMIISVSQTDEDANLLREEVGDIKQKAIEFKKPDSDFKVAIVVDMWLTGFDVPSLDTIYIDKPFFARHNLVQAITRVNRVFSEKNKVKENGLVVDYFGISKQFKDALSFYNNEKITQTKEFILK